MRTYIFQKSISVRNFDDRKSSLMNFTLIVNSLTKIIHSGDKPNTRGRSSLATFTRFMTIITCDQTTSTQCVPTINRRRKQLSFVK